jgi:two-component system, OmpR family, response regulator
LDEKPSKHILVVDDNDSIRNAVAAMLLDLGYRVSTAADGPSMRALLKTRDPVDAVVLDALIPGEDTFSLALRTLELGIPVIMTSGDSEAMKFAEANNLQHVGKPFGIDELQASLERATDDRRTTPKTQQAPSGAG